MNRPPDTLPYGGGTLPLPRPSRFRLDVPEPPPTPSAPRPGPEAALSDPIASPPLERVLAGARSVVIAVSDATRATGAAAFLPVLLDRLDAAGVRETTLAIGGGLHRRPTAEEVRRIVGDEVAAAVPVVLHDPDRADPVDLGRTRAGTPVRVHPALASHDAVLLTGAIGFHYYAGFSGGRKAVVPGLAARETVIGNHLRALRRDGSRHPRARAGVLAGNPVHRDMADGAARVRPAFLINTVLDRAGGIEAVFAGHWRRAHEAGCRYLRTTRSIRLSPRPLVVVSAGGAPHDVDLIQSHKAFEAVDPAVADGGTVILVARCPDGYGSDDLRRGLDEPDESSLVAALRADYRVYLQTALAWRRKLRRVRLILVSDLPDDAVVRAGARPAPDLHAALREAERTVPPGSSGWLVQHGVRFLVRPGG